MALTVTNLTKPHVMGDRWVTFNQIALDASYPTGGYSLTPQQLGFAATVDPDFQLMIDNDYGYGFVYDYTNFLLIAYSSAGTQVANATSLVAVTNLRLTAFGKFRS